MSVIRLDSKKLRHWPATVFALRGWNEDPLKSLDVGGNELEDVDIRIAQFKDSLTSLRLCSNKIIVLPPALFELAALKKLDLSSNPLREPLADTLQDSLPALVELCVAGCGLPRLPPLHRLACLEILRCGQNEIAALPEPLPPLLLELHADGNRLTGVDEAAFGPCARLRTLRLSINPLRVASLGCLGALATLDLHLCRLTEMPDLPRSPSLVDVLLGANAITSMLPLERSLRPSIETLDLSENRLTALPVELRALRKLHTLNLANNELQSLPAWLGFMPVLARLTVEGNPTRTIKRSALMGGAATLRAYLRSRATADEVVLFESEEAGAPVRLPAGLVLGGGGSVSSASSSPGKASAVAAAAASIPAPTYTADAVPHAGAIVAASPRSPAPPVQPPPLPAIPAVAVPAVATPSVVAPSLYAPPAAPAPAHMHGEGHGSALAAAASAAVSASQAEAGTAAWVFALREALSNSGRLELKPAAFGPSGVLQREGVPLARIFGNGPAGSDMSKAVRALVLDGNALAPDGSGLPAGILAALPLLVEVSAGGCGLSQVPPALCEAPSPASQRRSAELIRLGLARNPGLGTAGPAAFPPPGAGFPATLQWLDLSGCGLHAVPACVGALPRLTTLLLRGNAGLGAATATGGAAGSGDDAAVSAHESLAALAVPTLETLDLSECGLVRLPLACLGLSRLRTLMLTDNDLAAIAPHLATLPLLATLGIDGNPQRTVRTAVLTKGSAGVLAYLRTRIPEGDAGRYAPALQRLFAGAGAAGGAAAEDPPGEAAAGGRVPALPVPAASAVAEQQRPWATAREADRPAPAALAAPTADRGLARAASSGSLQASGWSAAGGGADSGGQRAPPHSARLSARGYGSAPPWATEDSSGPRVHPAAPAAAAAATEAAAPLPAHVAGGVAGGGGGPVWSQAQAVPPGPAPGPAAAAKHAELASVLARMEELNGDVQRGGMSSTLLAAVRRQLVVLRSNETRLRAELAAM